MRGPGAVIAVFGPFCGIGGPTVGRTTIAANLAVALAQTGQRVALVDLDFRFGDLSLYMDVAEEPGIADLPTREREVTSESVQRCLQKHATGVWILAASRFDLRSEEYEKTVRKTVGLLAKAHDAVILDTTPNTVVVTLALRLATTGLFVITGDLATLKDAQGTLDALRNQDCPLDRIKLIVNAIDESTSPRPDEIERVLRHKVFWSVPYDRNISAAPLGTPLFGALPNSKAAQSMMQLADMLTEPSGPSERAAQPTRGEYIKEDPHGMRLFGKKKQEPPREAEDVDPAVFDLPIAALLGEMSAAHDHQLDLNVFQTICDASVESAEDEGVPFVTDWVDTACKVGSVAMVSMLVNPEVDYLAWPGHVPTNRGIKRGLSVMAVAFGSIYPENERHRRMIEPLTGPEFIRICASSIDPLAASYLDSLAQRAKEGEGVALAFGTFRALHIALWAPELDAVPDDQEFHEFLKARGWPPRLTEAGLTTPVVTTTLIGHWYTDGFIPRLSELIRRHSGSALGVAGGEEPRARDAPICCRCQREWPEVRIFEHAGEPPVCEDCKRLEGAVGGGGARDGGKPRAAATREEW